MKQQGVKPMTKPACLSLTGHQNEGSNFGGTSPSVLISASCLGPHTRAFTDQQGFARTFLTPVTSES